MISSRRIIAFLFCIACIAPMRGDIYANIGSEVLSRYVFRGQIPAGPRSAATINASLYFSSCDIQLSQWYVNSFGDLSAFHESGTMLTYHYFFGDNRVLSGGLCAYLFPGQADRAFGLEFSLTFSDMQGLFPYYIETHFDPLFGSLYAKISGSYTLDVFLPVHFSLSTGMNLLSHTRFAKDIPAGFSDLSLGAASYLALKNWHMIPKLSYIIPLNKLIHDKMILQAGVNIGYAF